MNQTNQENQLHTVCFSQIHNTYIFRISLINIIQEQGLKDMCKHLMQGCETNQILEKVIIHIN